jgi:hypothetical protein
MLGGCAPRSLVGVQAHGAAEAPLAVGVVPERLEALAAQRALGLRVVRGHARLGRARGLGLGLLRARLSASRARGCCGHGEHCPARFLYVSILFFM